MRQSRPSRARELKLLVVLLLISLVQSRPSRARELKLAGEGGPMTRYSVAPLAGA